MVLSLFGASKAFLDKQRFFMEMCVIFKLLEHVFGLHYCGNCALCTHRAHMFVGLGKFSLHL